MFPGLTPINGGLSSLIESVQQLSVSIDDASILQTGTEAISPAMDASRTALFWGGFTSSGVTSRDVCSRITLTSGSLVTATTEGIAADGHRVLVSAVQFKPGVVKSIQYKTITIGGGSIDGSAVLSPAVNKNNSIFIYLGHTTNSTQGYPYITNTPGGYINTGAEVRAERWTIHATQTITMNCCIVEFNPGILKSNVQHLSPTIDVSTDNKNTLITSVDKASSMVVYGGMKTDYAASSGLLRYLVGFELTSNTNLATKRYATTAKQTTGYCCIAEFQPRFIKLVQRVTPQIAVSETTIQDTITTVVKAKTLTNYLGSNTSNTGANTSGVCQAQLTGTGGFTLQSYRGISSAQVADLYVEVVEFK